jgi:hypothetical protein
MRGHNCWNAAFLDYELLPWLLSQKRGKAPIRPVGEISTRARLRVVWHSFTRRWTLTQVLAQAVIPLILIFAIWSARRQRRFANPASRAGSKNEHHRATENTETKQSRRSVPSPSSFCPFIFLPHHFRL